MKRALAVSRIVLALLVLAAVGTQFAIGFQRPTFVPFNFWMFFTIQSNVIGATLLVVTGVGTLLQRTREWGLLRGAGTL